MTRNRAASAARPHHTFRVALFALCATVAAGCSQGQGQGPNAATPSASASSESAEPQASATPADSPAAGPAGCAEQILSQLTPQQRAGQLILASVDSTMSAPDAAGSPDVELLASRNIGGYLMWGKTARGAASLNALATQVNGMLNAETPQIQPWVSADHEGGLIQSLKGPGLTTLPSAQEQMKWGQAGLEQQAAAWGRELRSAGITLDFAPVADIVPAEFATVNEPIGKLNRGYGATAAEATPFVNAVVDGLQSVDVAATVKHFPGLGSVVGNTDFADNVVDTETTADGDSLGAFRSAVRNNVAFVMMSTATYEKLDATQIAAFSPKIVTHLLRKDLGFNGTIVSDDLGKAIQVQSIPAKERAVRFVRAGGDMAISVGKASTAVAMADGLTEAYANSPADRERIDQAALTVLRTKERFGLLTCTA